MDKLKRTIAREWADYKLLLRTVPAMAMVFFVTSCVAMNLLANAEFLHIGWLGLDCGFFLSWVAFLSMDMLTRRFGAKASIEISITAEFINLFFCLFFAVIMHFRSGNWGAFYDFGELDVVNDALNATFGGSWYVVLGSGVAFCVSAVVNSLLNEGIGKLTKSSNFKAFALRSYVSTAVGQFVDNLVFATLVSYVFFGWTWTQVIMCSAVGACAELAMEILFSPIGYRVCKKWESEKIGEEYIEHQGSIA